MRTHLQYPNPDNKADKKKLSNWVYEPILIADPEFRKKSVVKYSYKLVSVKVSISRVTKSMAKRLKKIRVI